MGTGAPSPRCKPASDAGGGFLQLRAGWTHVVDEGRVDDRTVLLVHGATVPHWVFDRLAPPLRAAGFRVVRFDLFGHGLSGRPAVEYDFDLFLGQTLEVLDSLRATRPLTILGYSFGAALAAAVAGRRPGLIERLVLVAPLLDFMAGAWWPKAIAWPGVGGPFMRWVGVPALVRRRRRRYAALGADELIPRYIAQARAPGYAEALASMFRNDTLGDQRERYQPLRASRHDIVVVAGEADRVVPLGDIARIREWLPQHRYLEIGGAEHNLLLTHAEQVAAAITSKTTGSAPASPSTGRAARDGAAG